MTDKELREQIQGELAKYGAGLLTHKLNGSVSECEAEARKILALIKQAGYVRLSDDQSLPKLEFAEIEETAAAMSNEDFAKVLAVMAVWVERMKKAGYRKVEL